MLWSRLPLQPRREGELDVWVTVCVLLKEPLQGIGECAHAPTVGYFRNFGIRLLGPQPKEFLERLISDGKIDWGESDFNEIDPISLDRDIRKQIVPPDENGIWYKSGQMYFQDDGATS